MDRRESLKTILGKENRSKKDFFNSINIRSKPVAFGLDMYSGSWTSTEAAHLMRRCMYGPTMAQINQAVDEGMMTTLALLLADVPENDPPVNPNYADDPYVPIGSTWVNAPYSTDRQELGYRNQSFNSWLMQNILNEGVSIKEKMVVFWHNHFVTANVNDPKFDFNYFNTLRGNALGNFRQFVKEITVNPSMLRYLNGNQNTKNAPNENFARELLELFTIGKGDQAGAGDYTNYTEQDIIEIARILTGWRDSGFRTAQDTEVSSFFRNWAHDTGQKKLSHRFNHVEIENEGEIEYATLIDVILQQQEVARYICRKIYRWFVYHIIDEATEANVIEPLSQLFMENDYEIFPVLEALLSSQHFFDHINNGCLIKNPIDFVFSTIKSLEVEIESSSLNSYYRINMVIHNFVNLLQMNYGNPPSVAGWKAYYQQPSFYQIWINSVTLPYRMNFTRAISLTGINQAGQRMIIDVLSLMDRLDSPSDINSLIDELVLLLFPQPITEKQIDFLKDILIPGLPDYEWTVEYVHYLNNLDDENTVKSMENKLRQLIDAMLSMPEFYLS